MTSEKVRKINEYITLKLEGKDSVIYVNGKRFLLCKRIILNIPVTKVRNFDNIDSIDEALEFYDHFLIKNNIYIEEKNMIYPSPIYYNIPPETEFWAHCSVRHEAVWLNAET